MNTDRPENVWRRLVVRVALYDASSMLAVVPIWVFAFGAAELGVMVFLTVLRLAWSQVLLRRIFAPLRRWQEQPGQLDGPELLLVDLALQQGPRRFAISNMIGTCVALVGATLLGMVGIPSPLEIGHAELMMDRLTRQFELRSAGVVWRAKASQTERQSASVSSTKPQSYPV